MTLENGIFAGTIEHLAVRFAGEPDDKGEALLADLQVRWTEQFCEVWPGVDQETMEAAARCIAEAVRKRRRCLGMA